MAAAPARKPTVIQYFRTGLFTRRSALFAPLRVIGIQVILLNDALIDGQDMELLDTYQLQRRPGFARFCSQALANAEVINQFYSERNSFGTVFPCFDSNQRFATFSPTAISTIWNKGSSAAQAFMAMVGTQMYIANGTTNGQKRFDTLTNQLHGMGIAAPAAMPVVPPPTVAGPTFWQPGVSYGTNNVYLLDPNGNIQFNKAYITSTALTTGSVPPAWNLSMGGVSAEASGGWQNFGPPGIWQASHVYTIPGPVTIIDSNGNLQHLTTTGTSGATQPTWATTIGSTTNDGTAVWTMRGNGSLTVFSGYLYMYVYSTQAPTVASGYYHASSGSPITFSTGPVFGPYGPTLTGAFSTSTDVGSVDIYRTKDGGSTFDYAGSIANNPAGGTWSFLDNITDNGIPPAGLNTSLVIPPGTTLLNDPPPGQTGSHAPSGDAISQIEWWQSRFWGVSGNKVYFTAGPDVTNGDPYACWPPANVFTFPGPVQKLTGTSAGVMLVWLPDCVKIIAGGPQTASFYPDDLLDEFGVSSPNCVSKDGDTIRALTTSGQVFELTVQNRTEISALIGDVVQQFPSSTSYLTMHRNGLDNGLFLGDGSTNMLRYGLNVQAWSPLYKPVGGVQALRSIETARGVYTLCAGRPGSFGGTNYILGRSLGTFQDDSVNYSNCFATIGNMVLSQPGEPLVPVYYVVGYFAAGGAVPTVFVMPNEISSTTGPGFVQILNPQDEPPLGAAPSQTLLAKQWNLYDAPMLKTSLLMHHLQVKIVFPQENFGSTIYGISLKHES